MVAAASRQGGVVTNGMSLRARDGANINGGLLVGVGPEDFPEADVLAGVWFQERWEKAAFQLGVEASGPLPSEWRIFCTSGPHRALAPILPTISAWSDLD